MVDAELTELLSRADRMVGRLDGISEILPNPDLFVGMYVRQEAVLSSQIEGTQSTLEDVLKFEESAKLQMAAVDADEVYNYVAAMGYGLEQLEASLPLSKRLIRSIHQTLLRSGRGVQSQPGEFRKTQNWIGPSGAPISQALFVPPAVPEMNRALDELEVFLHDRRHVPLIHTGLVHAQFETIHPFLDGNGRIGRLLITLMLCERAVLRRPVLYLSSYFKQRRAEYYDRLMAVRVGGDWEGWMKFFLRGVADVASNAVENTLAIRDMIQSHHQLVASSPASDQYARPLLDLLARRPILSMKTIVAELGCSTNTARKLVADMEAFKLLEEITGQKRNRLFRYGPYLDLFERFGPTASSQVEVVRAERTQSMDA